MKRSSPRAFTLIEILASASIVLILAGLLLPIFKKSQISARSALCTGNLRNLGAAFQLYAVDNNGLLPAMRYRSSSVGANPNPGQNNWQFEIFPYLDVAGTSMRSVSQKASSQHVFCPEYAREFKTDSAAQGLKCAGYGMAPIATGAYDNRIASAAVAKPASTILAGDSDDYHLDIDSQSWKEPKDKNRYGSGDPVRHGPTANYLFVDGHIRPLTPKLAEGLLTKTAEP
jgi:prepilin-type processing-associated H-X9-DG protein/prepilin-type N-terminal cleavage/methylation domain-containing protein